MRAPGTRYHQENTIERHRYGGAGWLIWGGIILGSRTDLHVQSVTMTGHIYRDVILEQHVRMPSIGGYLPYGVASIRSELESIEHVRDMLGRRIAARQPPTTCLPELRRALGTAFRGFISGRPRGATPADDRYIALQARRNRRQTAGEIARHTTQATERPISRFTVARRLHGGGLFARRPVRFVPLTPAHRRRRSLWCRRHRNWRDNEWGRVFFTDESRFSLSSDSHRILIWRERGSRNYPSNIKERDRYGGRGVLVWGGIMFCSRADLHIFDAGSVNETRYCNEILLPYVRLFRGAMGLQFLFMDDNAPCHRTVAAEQLLEISLCCLHYTCPYVLGILRCTRAFDDGPRNFEPWLSDMDDSWHPSLLTTIPHQREDVSALDRFNVHRCPTRQVFSDTGLELVTRQATLR
ncbi:transposable element Tcb2 transposase [Trichonephila clavipes]|nr:transposable element Tcb2 transposase [Trichonephila clavipes]